MGTRARRADAGQATVEMAVVLPVAIVVAVIVVNALTFLGTCATFDRIARQTVGAYASAPASGEDAASIAAAVERELDGAVGADNVEVSVRAEGTTAGLVRYTARIEYAPTLFGLGLREEVLGVGLPRLAHEVDMTVDAYRPGILF